MTYPEYKKLREAYDNKLEAFLKKRQLEKRWRSVSNLKGLMSPKIEYQTKNSIIEAKITRELKNFTENASKLKQNLN